MSIFLLIKVNFTFFFHYYYLFILVVLYCLESCSLFLLSKQKDRYFYCAQLGWNPRRLNAI